MLLTAVTAASAGPATAVAPPEYFVDETKLPFTALPGIDTDRYWGVHNGAGYRMERWVEGGVKPAGDDVLTPEVVAAPTYGCAFTSATRNLGPFTAPCP